MKLSKFWWISTITGALLLFFLACHTQKDMQPDKAITHNLLLFEDFYPEAATDYEVESIAHHYMTGEDDPDAYGHILVDFDNVEVPIYVYSGPRGMYWYKLDVETGAECVKLLTKEQRKHVWSFN